MKIEEVKIGSIIINERGQKFLVLKIDKDRNAIKALGQDFNEISLGIYPWIKDYSLVENINMDYIFTYDLHEIFV